MSDSYRTGLDVLNRIGAGLDARHNRVAELAPDFVRIAIGFGYGEILARPGLPLKDRALAAVAAQAALGASIAQLRSNVSAALQLGWHKSEILEVLMQTALHAGFARALDALAQCHDLLVEGAADCQSCEASDDSNGQA
ncbi:carboxymuconolactone decarboxylase family protein [Sandarakinorhabdus rubra]|uniref:carboxymuconolactone decarboxylase family protein n=1 Tax=Sandarakinorhabdus rubra TaxID=2672568 RepID=UPI0013DD8575|nr:carboxymuconolactone decarboxylase family protein [Sandarakinorhabdus rubra]